MSEAKIRVNRNELLQALNQTKYTISETDAQEVLRNFMIECIAGDDGTGKLRIIATDRELASLGECSASVGLGNETQIKFTVPGVKLVQAVESINAESFEINKRGDFFHIVVGTPSVPGYFECCLKTLPADDFPDFPHFETPFANEVSRELFLNLLKRISFSVNDVAVYKKLLAVNITKGVIQASNAQITTVCESKEMPDINMTIPQAAVHELIQVLTAAGNILPAGIDKKSVVVDSVGLDESSNFLLFAPRVEAGNFKCAAKFICRKTTAKFPTDTINKIVAETKKVKTFFSFDKDKLFRAIRRVSVAADEKTMSVLIKLSGKSVELMAKDGLGNHAKELLEAEQEWNGKDGAVFRFNYENLLSIISSIHSKNATLRVAEGNIRLPARVDDADFIALLMQIIL